MTRRNKFILMGVFSLLILSMVVLPFIREDTTALPERNLGKVTLGSLKSEV